jgi:hypothetical protein
VYDGTAVRSGPQGGVRAQLFAALFRDVLPRPALHAASLALHHPLNGAWLEFRSPLPADMVQVINALGGEVPATSLASCCE